jgi:hypothetical protein
LWEREAEALALEKLLIGGRERAFSLFPAPLLLWIPAFAGMTEKGKLRRRFACRSDVLATFAQFPIIFAINDKALPQG